MFATIPNTSTGKSGEVPFFGLPDNPIACAVCLRFLAMHYVKCLQAQLPESRLTAQVSCPNDTKTGP